MTIYSMNGTGRDGYPVNLGNQPGTDRTLIAAFLAVILAGVVVVSTLCTSGSGGKQTPAGTVPGVVQPATTVTPAN